MNTTEFNKLKPVLRATLHGMALMDKRYYEVIAAFNFAEAVHQRINKDETVEFYHQLSILAKALTYHTMLLEPVETYIAILLHDVPEDYPEYQDALASKFPLHAKNAQLLNKYAHVQNLDGSFTSTKKDIPQYFACIAASPALSVAKGLDRDHNLSRMITLFSLKKQQSYADEVETYLLPMLKVARYAFPEQSMVYESIKSSLSVQANTIRHFLAKLNAPPAMQKMPLT